MNGCCAVIDFGTNTARLLIAECSPTGIVPILVEREIVRLGGGFCEDLGLSADAYERGQNCLVRFSEIVSEYCVQRVMATATSAVRDASNGRAFVDEVLRRTGIELLVIDGNTEAKLTLRGVLSSLESDRNKHVILDVGGGSTEFTVSSDGVPVFIKSMPIGVVRLTEGFCTEDSMFGRVNNVLDQLEADLLEAGINVAEDFELVGTAGTATTVAAIKMEMVDYDYRQINNSTVSIGEVAEIFQRLSLLSPEDRLSVKGLEKGREDLIIAGLVIFLSVMERFGFSELKVSDFGLLEGLALSCCESAYAI